VPKAVYRSGCRDKHNRPECDSNLGPLTPQSDALTTRLLGPETNGRLQDATHRPHLFPRLLGYASSPGQIEGAVRIVRQSIVAVRHLTVPSIYRLESLTPAMDTRTTQALKNSYIIHNTTDTHRLLRTSAV